jgi:hypothetical protein
MISLRNHKIKTLLEPWTENSTRRIFDDMLPLEFFYYYLFISNQKSTFLWANLLTLEPFAPLNGATQSPSPMGGSSNFLLYFWIVMMMMEKLVVWMVLTGETEVLGENLHRRHFVHHKSPLPDPGANPGRRGGKPATNRFSYGTASFRIGRGEKTKFTHACYYSSGLCLSV